MAAEDIGSSGYTNQVIYIGGMSLVVPRENCSAQWSSIR